MDASATCSSGDSREKAYKVSTFARAFSAKITSLLARQVVAYSAVTFSLVAILAVCVTMPLALNFVAHVQQQADKEIKHCKV